MKHLKNFFKYYWYCFKGTVIGFFAGIILHFVWLQAILDNMPIALVASFMANIIFSCIGVIFDFYENKKDERTNK